MAGSCRLRGVVVRGLRGPWFSGPGLQHGVRLGAASRRRVVYAGRRRQPSSERAQATG